ncbi:HAMP domain-containing protein, partial [Phaeobacter sp. HF9A]|nr:HAMP domain-containing protein [Phaeobacter sp. HF9A]
MTTPEKKPPSIRGLSVFAKTGLLIVAATLVTATFIMLANKLIIDRNVKAGVQALSVSVTDSVASRSGGAIRFGDQEKLLSDLQRVIETSHNQALHGVAINTKGEIVASFGTATEAQVADLVTLAQVASQTGAQETTGDGDFVAAPATTSKGATVGAVAMLWSSQTAMTAALQDQAIAAAIGIGILLLMCFVSATVLRRAISKPLNELSDMIVGIAGGDYSHESEHLARADEIGRIARNVEDLKHQLADASALEEKREQAQASQKKVVDALNHALKHMSDGDLTHALSEPFSEEYEPLRRHFNSTRATMVSIIDSVIECSERIRSSAEQISVSSGDLSQRTESQAATLEETAAAMEQLNGSVRSAAHGAREVEGIMEGARATAEQSSLVVSNAVEAMSKIEASSSKISQILTVIDDIAFQTNLLALNAGVEA